RGRYRDKHDGRSLSRRCCLIPVPLGAVPGPLRAPGGRRNRRRPLWCGSVGQDDHAGVKGVGCDQFQWCTLSFTEQQLAVAHHWVYGEPELVDELVPEKRLPQTAVAVHDQVSPWLLLELTDRLHDVTAHDGAAGPLSRSKAAREHVLRH